MQFPLVSIISVNYNQSQITCELLNSLRHISYPRIEIIIIDNASPNDEPDQIKELYPEINLIKSETNLGFAGGNNLGIKASKGEYLFFLNNDTEVPEAVLEPLVTLLQNDLQIGMVSPKIKYFKFPEMIQYAGFSKMNPWTIRNKGIGFHQMDGPQYNRLSETAFVHGAAMMVPRRVIDAVGMMPEIYFLYYEEYDWTEMIKRAGLKIFYQPESYVLHKESVSTGKNSPLKTYYLTRNRLLFARRNFNGIPFIGSMIFQIVISIPKNILFFLFRWQPEHLKAYLKGIKWNLLTRI